MRRVQSGVRLAVFLGVSVDLKKHPERRDAYVKSEAALAALVLQDKWDALAFSTALSESGAGSERASVVWNAGSKSGIERKMRNAMEASPGTLLCMDDVIASRSLSWLHRHGYSIPRDVSLMSFHDSAAMEDHIPSITALHVNIHDLGCAAANNLIDAANGRETAKKILVPYRLIIRDSSRI